MKKLTIILLTIVILLGFTGCGIIEDMQFDSALKNGDYHVLVPEGDDFTHKDGSFQDFDTYCVFTVNQYKGGLQTGEYEHITEYWFPKNTDNPNMSLYTCEYNDITYYINVYSVYSPAKTVIIAGTELPGWEEGWAYVGLSGGEIPAHPSTLVSYEDAPAENIDGRTVYTLDTATKEDVRVYGNYLMGEAGWMYCTDLYDNPTDEYRYIEQFCKDDSYMMLLWYNGVTKVIVSDEKIMDSEQSLWALVDGSAAIVAGEQYIREQIAHLGPAVNQVGTGEGYDTAGIVYRYTYHGSMGEFDSLVNKAKDLGFTEDVTRTNENDVYEFSAWRHETYGDDAIKFFVHIIFDGEYLETQMGTNADCGSHRQQ